MPRNVICIRESETHSVQHLVPHVSDIHATVTPCNIHTLQSPCRMQAMMEDVLEVIQTRREEKDDEPESAEGSLRPHAPNSPKRGPVSPHSRGVVAGLRAAPASARLSVPNHRGGIVAMPPVVQFPKTEEQEERAQKEEEEEEQEALAIAQLALQKRHVKEARGEQEVE